MTAARRLAAILPVDVFGDSRLMGEDEAGTAKAVREHRDAAHPITLNANYGFPPEIDPPRKSRIRARHVISADSLHGRAYGSVARGKVGRSAEPPKEFFIEAASGLLNCDRCGKLSFSTLST